MNDEIRAALADVLDIAEEMGLRSLLVGAWARDLCLPAERRGPERQTSDVDLTVVFEDWTAVDALFESCRTRFEDHREELFLRHRPTQVKVDVVPCGGIETPTGRLVLRASTRVLNTVGLAEAFASAGSLEIGRHCLAVPTPSAYILFKLLSFLDRRAPRDLRDLGYVVRRAPVDEERVWSDTEVLDQLADGRLTLDDMSAWQLGRGVARQFSEATTRAFARSLVTLAGESDTVRTLLVDAPDPDERVAAADRLLEVLTSSVGG